MASFDPEEAKENRTSTSMVKCPMKRLELSIRKFIKVLDIDLDRLYKHRENIKKLTNAEDWTGLHREQVNASRTIQQINANIREIERARTQVQDSDLRLFDDKVQDVKTKALNSMEEFMDFIGPGTSANSNIPTVKKPSVETGHASDSIVSPLSPHREARLQKTASLCSESNSHPRLTTQASLPIEADLEQIQEQDTYGTLSISMTTYDPAPVSASLHVAPQHSDASHSWEQLQENIVELNDLVHHFASEVQEQGEVINTIDENIETSHHNVKEGTLSLAKAATYKSAMLPVVGAVVGGVLGGPIGLMAGMKLGGLALVVGGGAGYAGGRMLKKRQQAINSIELENLSEKRSISLAEVETTSSGDDDGKSKRSTEVEEAGLLCDAMEDVDLGDDKDQVRSPAGGTIQSTLSSVYDGVTSPFQKLFSSTSRQSK